jgi:antitoxin (DNA-binding transcriptional repressor) of toxin-antitoxin stability system
MKKVSITEAKNSLSALIDGLKSGSPVLILDRGRPVARLEPVLGSETDDERLARLIREGVVRPRRRPLSRKFFTEELPKAKDDVSVVAALIQERREGW